MNAAIFALVTTVVLIITFYIGRWFGIKFMMRQIEKEIAAKELSSIDEERR
jgi:uncharacterized protein YneF (UPF0154 family)